MISLIAASPVMNPCAAERSTTLAHFPGASNEHIVQVGGGRGGSGCGEGEQLQQLTPKRESAGAVADRRRM